MTSRNPFRVAVVNTHPIQYFAPLYAYLNRAPDLDITALYCSDISLRGGMDPGFKQPITWDVDLLGGYRSVFLGKRAKQRVPDGFFSLICPQIWGEIRSGRYDAVWLHGYNYASHLLAFLAARSRRLPVFLRGDTHLGLQRSGWRRRARQVLLGAFCRRLAGCLAVGTANRAYYRSLGVPDERIFDVPFAVDNARFIAASSVSPEQRRTLRMRYGLPTDQPVVLFASKFTPRKHPDDLVDAVWRLRRDGLQASLLMVGTGELEPSLRKQVAKLGMDNVTFTGFVNQSELPDVFASADVFVLPAENEPWGLVVNEAMCAGLPVIVGSSVGCVPDLVHNGANGRQVPAGNVQALTAALHDVLSNENQRRAMGRKSLEIIESWSYAQCLEGGRQALEQAELST